MFQSISEQPYRTYIGQCDGVYSMISDTGFEGCGIITSGNNKLNINYDTYYWNGEKVDVPKEELVNIASGNNNTQIISKGDRNSVTIGNSNIANTGDNNSITLSFAQGFSLGTIFGVILTFLLNTIYDLWGREFFKRRFKKK